MGFGEVAMAALYFVLRFGLTFSDRLGGSYAWGEEITFTAPEGWTETGVKQSYTKAGVTISTTQGAGDVQYRIYKGQTFTVSSTVGNITKIEITCTAKDKAKYGPGCFETIEGYSYSGKIGTKTRNPF